MRKHIWKLHSWIGLICAFALVVIGMTGSVLVFHQEITDFLYSEATLNEEDLEHHVRCPLSELTSVVERAFPDFWIRGWLLNTDPNRRDKVYLTERGGDDWYILHVDPYTTGHGETPLQIDQTIYGWFVQLHYTFFADHIGMALAGLFALAFVFLGISGIYLHRPFFKAFIRLRWGKSTRIFFSDLHKAIGISTIPMNLIFGFTGAYWNITHLAHEIIEHANEEHEHTALFFPEYQQHVDQLGAIADVSILGYQLNYIYFPTKEDPNFYLYGQHQEANAFNSLYGSHIWVSAESGEVTYFSNLKEAGFFRQLADSFEPLHFGYFGGLTSKLIWCFAGLSPGILSVTGVVMFWKRKFRKRRRIS